MSCKHSGHAYGDRATIGQRKPRKSERCFCGSFEACGRCGEAHIEVLLCLVCAVRGPQTEMFR